MLKPTTAADPQPRVPPHSHDGEQALLGAILANNRSIQRVSEYLRADHFADPLHGRIYAACQTLIERGQLANPITLRGVFDTDADMIKMDGQASGSYLARLVGAAANAFTVNDYGKLVYDNFLRRAMISAGEDLISDAYDGSPDKAAQTVIAKHVTDLMAADTAVPGGGLISPKVALAAVLEGAEKIVKGEKAIGGISTGLPELDKITGGLFPGDLIILAGRPSMGKSALATTMGFNVASKLGTRVDYYSPEMGKEQLWQRILAPHASVSAFAQRSGPLTAIELGRLQDAARWAQEKPFFIDDGTAPTVASILSRSSRSKAGLIMVDYLQMMQAVDAKQNRASEIEGITRGLKKIARDLGVPVVALSQLSRKVEERDDKRPNLSDLRESGAIEQDADVVMFVFREEYYLAKSEPKPNHMKKGIEFDAALAAWRARLDEVHTQADVIVDKQRAGPTGVARLAFIAEHSTFASRAVQESFDLI